MWDETDYTSRWIQGICAVLLAMVAVFFGWYTLNHFVFVWIIGGLGISLASVKVKIHRARVTLGRLRRGTEPWT